MHTHTSNCYIQIQRQLRSDQVLQLWRHCNRHWPSVEIRSDDCGTFVDEGLVRGVLSSPRKATHWPNLWLWLRGQHVRLVALDLICERRLCSSAAQRMRAAVAATHDAKQVQ